MILPNWIELSLIEKCTRACKICPRSNRDEFPNQDLKMNFRLCEKIADELYAIGFKGTVILAGYGEPLLYPDVVKVVKLFSEVGKIEIVTNGDPLTPELAKMLFVAGLDKLHVSMYDGAWQTDMFSDMLSKVISNDKYELRERWYDFGTLTNRAGTVFNECGQSGACYYMCYSMMVDWNGDVIMCPQDWRKRVRLGNLNFNTVSEIWYSNNADTHRKPLLLGKRSLAPCKFCDANGTKKGIEEAIAWKEYYGIE